MCVALSAIIPTYGRATLLGRTIASLGACDIPEGYCETVVVENGVPAGAEAVVAQAACAYPHLKLRYLHVARANKSHALNEALKTMCDGLIVFFDDDARMVPGLLKAYAEAAAKRQGGTFFGGPVRCNYEKEPPAALRPLLPYSAKGFTMRDARKKGYFLGTNWAAFKEDIAALGYFDPNFGPGSPTGARGQEKNMQLRLREAGFASVEVPEAHVEHYVPASNCSPGWVMRRFYQNGANRGLIASAENDGEFVLDALKKTAVLSIQAVLRLGRRNSTGFYRTITFLVYNAGIVQSYVRGSFKQRCLHRP